MTHNDIDNPETLQELFCQLTEKYRDALKNDIPFEKLKAIYLQLKDISASLSILSESDNAQETA